MQSKNPHAKVICGAKTRSGGVCQNPAMDNGRCRMHGGETPRGIALPQFKTGRYSKDLAAAPGLLARYREERETGETTKLVDEISLLRARAGELLQNLEHHESGELWEQLNETFGKLTKAIREKDSEASAQLLREIGTIIEQGAKPYEIWEEITSHLTLIGKLSRVELTRETKQQETMTAREAAVFKSIVETNLRDALQRNLDPELVQRVLVDFASGVRRDLARQPSQLSGPRGGS